MTFVHPLMALLFCGCAEFFRTDGRHCSWRVTEYRVGLSLAGLTMLAGALSGLYFSLESLGTAGFVLFLSLIAAGQVLFLTIGALAMVGQVLDWLLGRNLWPQSSS